MWKRFGPAVWATVLLAGTLLTAEAQPRSGPGVVSYSNTGTIVFRGTPAAPFGVAEVPGYGGSSAPGYTTSAGGTTVFHGTPGRTAGPWPAPPPPPWALPPSALGGEK
jgi:hypothetical protein